MTTLPSLFPGQSKRLHPSLFQEKNIWAAGISGFKQDAWYLGIGWLPSRYILTHTVCAFKTGVFLKESEENSRTDIRKKPK